MWKRSPKAPMIDLDRHAFRTLSAAARRPGGRRSHSPSRRGRQEPPRRPVWPALDRPRHRAQRRYSWTCRISRQVSVHRRGTTGLWWRAHQIRFPTIPGEACRLDTIARLPILVHSLSEGSDRRVWIGTSSSLIEFDGVGFRWYSTAHGLVNHTINAVAEDRAGHVWIGADAGGVPS